MKRIMPIIALTAQPVVVESWAPIRSDSVEIEVPDCQPRIVEESVPGLQGRSPQKKFIKLIDECKCIKLDAKNLFKDNRIELASSKIVLRLTKKIDIEVTSRNTYLIPDWGVELNTFGACGNSLRAEFSRRFQTLSRKAMNHTDTPEEARQWYRILETFDYKDYSNQIRPSLPTQARRIRREGETVFIDFFDGREIPVEGRFARDLEMVHDGESFTVRYKAVGGKIVNFDDIRISADGMGNNIS